MLVVSLFLFLFGLLRCCDGWMGGWDLGGFDGGCD